MFDHEPRMPRLVIWMCVVFLATILLGTFVMEVDEIVLAQGQVTRLRGAATIQVAEAGVVESIYVQEGDFVQAGDRLALIARGVADSDLSRVETESKFFRFQLARVEAESTRTPLVPPKDLPAERVNAVMSLYRTNVAAFDARDSAIRSKLEEADADVQAARHRVRELELLVEGTSEEIARIETATQAGLLPQRELRQMKRESDSNKQRLLAERESLGAAVARSRQQLGELQMLQTSRLRDLESERVELQQQISALAAESVRYASVASKHEIKSPVDGVVQDIGISGPGTVAAQGLALLTVAPIGEPPLIESWVENVDIARLSVGMEAQVKVHALNYQDYGLLPAVLESISATAGQMPEQLPSARSASELSQAMRAQLGYRVRLSIDESRIPQRLKGKVLPTGMLVTAEIVVGRRKVIDYLLAPARRMVAEAGREPG